MRGPKSLPYAYQLAAFADMARRLEGNQLNPGQLAALQTWFWATTYGEYFTGMPANRIRDAIDYLWRVLDGGADPLPEDLPRDIEPLKDFNFTATRSKALALLMAAQITDADLRAQVELRLGEMGNDAIDKLYPDQPSSKPENRVVATPSELTKLRVGIVLLPNDAPRENRRELLDRYLVPHEADVLILDKPETKRLVLQQRRERLLELESRHIQDLGLRIFAKDGG